MRQYSPNFASPRDFADLLLKELRTRHVMVPARHDVELLVETLFAASLSTEEGEAFSIQAAWLDPRRPDPSPPKRLRRSRWSWVPFPQPVAFRPETLTKLAPATDPRCSWLGVFRSTQGLAIYGLVDQLTLANDFVTREGNHTFEPPGVFQVRVQGPGHLQGMIGLTKVAELRAGQLAGPAADVFRAGLIRQILDVGMEAHLADVRTALIQVPPDELDYLTPGLIDTWLDAVRRLLLRADGYRHGGAYVITPDLTLVGLNVKYPLSYSRLKDALLFEAVETCRRFVASERIHETYLRRDRKTMDVYDYLEESVAEDELSDSVAELNGTTRFVSLLTRVDGAVVLDARLGVSGFGVEIQQDQAPDRVLRLTSPLGSTTDAKVVDYNHFGTRHRSMMRYCWGTPGSVGFVISHDGGVKAMTRGGSDLFLWDPIQLEHELSPRGFTGPARTRTHPESVR